MVTKALVLAGGLTVCALAMLGMVFLALLLFGFARSVLLAARPQPPPTVDGGFPGGPSVTRDSTDAGDLHGGPSPNREIGE